MKDILTVDIFTVEILTVDILTVDILTVDILTVDMLTVDILTVGILTVDILTVDIPNVAPKRSSKQRGSTCPYIYIHKTRWHVNRPALTFDRVHSSLGKYFGLEFANSLQKLMILLN
jgi:hypothetical protein